ncbi:alpha/beta hydrolase [Listeria booriae]|uniref:alpha/beta hydrolase n=1 Tax=Listeria booriae TaxID=1552123 RepID=UPI00162630B4|nr:alpha/beta hydrolase [Listeria booriae]MBC1503403.1 alpha/beta hydrolase [Listeria booriae]
MMGKKAWIWTGVIVVAVLLFMAFRMTLLDPLGFRVKHALHITTAAKLEGEPIVFIHGYDGSNWTFFTTTIRYSATDFGTRSLKLLVRENGDIDVSGVYDKAMKRPMIRVNFENPRSIIPNNATWFSKAMELLKKDYGIEDVDIVGDLDDGSRSDGPVAVDSAKSAAFIFNPANYQQVLFTGRFAQHSWLHANIGVDREIKSFIEANR